MNPVSLVEGPEATGPPDRSYTQRMEALAKANTMRVGRSQLKREIRSGKRDVIAVLARPTPLTEKMKVIDLLLAAPKIGRVKANEALRKVRVSPTKTIGGLSPRQRQGLIKLIGAKTRRVGNTNASTSRAA